MGDFMGGGGGATSWGGGGIDFLYPLHFSCLSQSLVFFSSFLFSSSSFSVCVVVVVFFRWVVVCFDEFLSSFNFRFESSNGVGA